MDSKQFLEYLISNAEEYEAGDVIMVVTSNELKELARMIEREKTCAQQVL